jgi:hypothetical protein
VIYCHKCGAPQPALSAAAERIRKTESLMIDACVRLGLPVSTDGRVGESDAAALLSIHPAGLKHLRLNGTGPAWIRRGIHGCKLSYSVNDLAAWIEGGRVETIHAHTRR